MEKRNFDDDVLADIPFNNIDEFIDLWNDSVLYITNSVCHCVTQQLSRASLTGNKRLVWLDMDMILFGMPRLDDIKLEIEHGLYVALKYTNKLWCQKQTEFLSQQICHTSRIYFDTIHNHSVTADHHFYGLLLEQEITRHMGNICFSSLNMPFFYSNTSLANIIFECNFIQNFNDGRFVSCWSWKQQKEIQILIMLSVHNDKHGGLFESFDENLVKYIVQSYV